MWSRKSPSRLPLEPDRLRLRVRGGRAPPARDTGPAPSFRRGLAPCDSRDPGRRDCRGLRGGAGRDCARAAGAAVARADLPVLRADRAPGGARGGQHLHHQAGGQLAAGFPAFRSILRSVLRGSAPPAARARPAGAGLGRDRPRGWPDRHQSPRDRGCRGDHGGAVGPARVPGRDPGRRRDRRSHAAAHRGRQGAPAGAHDGRFRPARGRRSGPRDRQPVRHRHDGHQRHRLGARPHHARHRLRPVVHPDRCRDQPRQLRRRPGHPGWPAGRHQHRDLHPDRRLDRHRLRDPGQPGQGADPLGRERRRCAGEGMARRQDPAGRRRPRLVPRAAGGRAACW